MMSFNPIYVASNIINIFFPVPAHLKWDFVMFKTLFYLRLEQETPNTLSLRKTGVLIFIFSML